VSDETKRAVELAAQEDDRSVASYVERLLIAHLKERGLLPQ